MSRGEQLPVQPQLGHQESRRFAVSRFVRDEAFEPTLNVVRLQDIQKSGVRTPKFVVGDY